MIDELHVENVALIRDATIQPAAGLTVLTGETGTGKSALLSSIKLLMGERADAGAVREGARGLSVEARVFLPGGDEEGCVVRRRVEASGRGRVEVDGRMSSVRELASGVGASIDLCGQHEHQRLLDVATHAQMLDLWAGEGAVAAKTAYEDALRAAREAGRALEQARSDAAATGERLEEEEFVLGRIDAVNPQEGELDELEATLPKAQHAEAILRSVAAAREAISGDGCVADELSDASRELADATRYDASLQALADRVESSLIELTDVAASLRDYEDDMDFDAEALDRMQQRMAQLQGLLRAYGPGMDDVMRRRERAAQVVGAAQGGGERVREAEREAREAEAQLARAADALDAIRREAAPRLAQAVTQQMAFLEMGSASIEVAVERLPRRKWDAQGPSSVELMYRPAAGLTARPLRKIASGGEVSRVMLALKVVLGEADGTETLVFDEVDAGVGGATAVALAQVLARLARTHQVIVVTHLAQVAVVAERHYLVEKSDGDVPETTIREIEGEERVREVARMLSGDTGRESLRHARQMLGVAAGEPEEAQGHLF